MPVTPFHVGPGAALHAIAPRQLSFLAFCAANVLIDLEPLYYMLTGQYPLHRWLHTYLGATLITMLTLGLFVSARKLSARFGIACGWLQLPPGPLWAGAAAGAYTHIVLDSVMHADIQPLAPFSHANALFQMIPVTTLHVWCMCAAVAGILVMALRGYLRRKHAG